MYQKLVIKERQTISQMIDDANMHSVIIFHSNKTILAKNRKIQATVMLRTLTGVRWVNNKTQINSKLELDLNWTKWQSPKRALRMLWNGM